MSALTKRCAAVSQPSCRSLSSFNRSMSVSSASFCWIWISLLFLVSTSAGVKEINAKSGDSVTLQCNSSRNALFKLLEWIKIQQPENLNVYVWRDEKSSPDDQSDDFKKRVELKDPEMKDGDVSVILKNITINDTGTYECSVGYGGKAELINTINLTFKPDVKEINAKSGDSVTLQCISSRKDLFKLLEWNKPQQPENLIVYVWRGGKPRPGDQSDDFVNRVELKDPEMKDGDVSVILKNVNINDTGTYECRVGYGEKPELINTINLTVSDSGHTGGHIGLIVGVSLTVVALVVAAIVGFVLYRKGHRGQDSY